MSEFYGWSVTTSDIDDSIIPAINALYDLGSADKMFKSLYLCHALTVDSDNAEALLIRKHGDAGDLLVVDTLAMRVDVKGDIVGTGDLTLSKWAGLGTGKVFVDNDGKIYAEEDND